MSTESTREYWLMVIGYCLIIPLSIAFFRSFGKVLVRGFTSLIGVRYFFERDLLSGCAQKEAPFRELHRCEEHDHGNDGEIEKFLDIGDSKYCDSEDYHASENGRDFSKDDEFGILISLHFAIDDGKIRYEEERHDKGRSDGDEVGW